MRVGTTPESIQVDVRAPIISRMKIAGPVLLRLSVIPASSRDQGILR